MLLRPMLWIVTSFALYGCAVGSPGSTGVVSETFYIPANAPGIQLHIRNKHLAGLDGHSSERTLLMVHGATLPAGTAFDLDLPGGSWMEYAASRGFDVYLIDIRGYGQSTRPSLMEAPPEANVPFADTKEAVSDISVAVDFIRKRRGVARVNLLGWSWGTSLMAGYAAEQPAKVEKLVLFAPMWHPWPKPQYRGAYRTSTLAIRGSGIPKERLDEIFPLEWFNKWREATLATDPVGASRSPPVIRAPNGVLKDMADIWGQGQATYDPSAIGAPTLLIVGEWDNLTPPNMAQELFKRLTAAKNRRVVVLSEGSHQYLLQKNRMRLIREVQHFLEEPSQ